jgi:hypothetical protein
VFAFQTSREEILGRTTKQAFEEFRYSQFNMLGVVFRERFGVNVRKDHFNRIDKVGLFVRRQRENVFRWVERRFDNLPCLWLESRFHALKISCGRPPHLLGTPENARNDQLASLAVNFEYDDVRRLDHDPLESTSRPSVMSEAR